MDKKWLGLALCLVLLVFVACSKTATTESQEKAQPATAQQPSSSSSVDDVSNSMEKSMADVDQMGQDLNMDELNSLDEDLSSVDNMDLS